MTFRSKALLLLFAMVLMAWAYAWAKDKFFRRRGMWVEKQAVRALKLPEDWVVSADVPVPGFGNCDVLITSPDEVRYAVEIKSAESARKVWFSLFTKDEIRKGNGERFPRDHVVQTLGVANKLNAIPILWLPKASYSKRFKTRSGVVVVLGGHKVLKRAIGARRGWFWL